MWNELSQNGNHEDRCGQVVEHGREKKGEKAGHP